MKYSSDGHELQAALANELHHKVPLKRGQQLLKLVGGVHAVLRDFLRSRTFRIFRPRKRGVTNFGARFEIHFGKLESKNKINEAMNKAIQLQSKNARSLTFVDGVIKLGKMTQLHEGIIASILIY